MSEVREKVLALIFTIIPIFLFSIRTIYNISTIFPSKTLEFSYFFSASALYLYQNLIQHQYLVTNLALIKLVLIDFEFFTFCEFLGHFTDFF